MPVMPSTHTPRSRSDAPLVFITGASSGIGQALALRFAQAGYRLALVARRAREMQAWADARAFDATECRVYGADVPMPYAANLEKLALPQIEHIIEAAKQVSYAA